MASVIFAACFATQGFALQFTSMGQDEPRSHDEVRIVDSEQSFATYALTHGRAYQQGSAEFDMRLQLFNKRAAEVERLNRKNTRWTAAVNMFADRTDEEQKMYFGYKANSKRKDDDVADEDIDISSLDTMPENFDWSNYSSVQFIRDQGGCGSCWAVTATTVLGAHSEIHGTNRSFSTQEVVDCVPNPNKCGGTGGCEGATVELAFQYAMNVGAREPEQYGAYKAVDGTCDWTPTDKTSPSLHSLTNVGSAARTYKADSGAPGKKFGLMAWQKLSSNKAAPLLAAVYQLGPVAVALAANDVMYYSHGVLDGCSDWTVNHAVTMIGFGTDPKEGKYWLIQNSWGASWGEAGRFRLARTDDEDNNCGTDKDPQAGLACEGETDPVTVCGTCGVLYDSVVPRFTKPSL